MLSKNTSISNKLAASIFRILALQGEYVWARYTHKTKQQAPPKY